ncbi:hypothetical protein KA977_08915 [Candidatus Dependentiae bacterium]|nr:hypothetical protein [Candidatus Dependentiae bacterium]
MDFLWSITRDQIFNECKRKYYYQYIAAYNENSGQISDLWKLKKLENRFLIRSKILKYSIYQILKNLMFQEEKGLEYYLRDAVKNFKVAVNKERMDNFENYYGIGEKTDYTEIFYEMHTLLENFYKSDSYMMLKNKKLLNCIFPCETHNVDYVTVAGKQIEGQADLIYISSDETMIFNWAVRKPSKKFETNISKNDEIRAVISYLFCEKNYFISCLDDVKYYLVNLYQTFSSEIKITQKVIDDIRNYIRISISKMQMAESNDIETFSKIKNKKICNFCNYKKICFDK